MLGAMWRLSKAYRLRPWRSPYLLWRIETYSGLHADRITSGEFWNFVWTQRRELMRFLHWADRMHAAERANS